MPRIKRVGAGCLPDQLSRPADASAYKKGWYKYMADKSNFLSDIAALAKAGYKPNDIKELLQLSKPTEPEAEKPAPIPEKDPAQPDPANGSTDPKVKEAEKAPEEPAQDANEAKIAELQDQIKKLQEQNASRDNSGDRSQDTEKQIADLISSYM